MRLQEADSSRLCGLISTLPSPAQCQLRFSISRVCSFGCSVVVFLLFLLPCAIVSPSFAAVGSQ